METGSSPLVIIGAGGHGRETLDIVEAINRRQATWQFLGFVADGEKRPELSVRRGVRILGGIEKLREIDASYVIAVGLSAARKEIDQFASSLQKEAAILVHPAAVLGSEIHLEPGCCIAPGAILTTNIRIGRHTHIDIGASISHDVTIQNWCTICPGVRIAGWVEIQDGVAIGIGAVLRDRIKIGENVIIGAGSVVIEDVPSGLTVAGVPARPVRHSRNT